MLTHETGRMAAQEEIFASSFAAAAYLQSIDFPKDKKVSLTLFKIIQNMRKFNNFPPSASGVRYWRGRDFEGARVGWISVPRWTCK